MSIVCPLLVVVCLWCLCLVSVAYETDVVVDDSFSVWGLLSASLVWALGLGLFASAMFTFAVCVCVYRVWLVFIRWGWLPTPARLF